MNTHGRMIDTAQMVRGAPVVGHAKRISLALLDDRAEQVAPSPGHAIPVFSSDFATVRRHTYRYAIDRTWRWPWPMLGWVFRKNRVVRPFVVGMRPMPRFTKALKSERVTSHVETY